MFVCSGVCVRCVYIVCMCVHISVCTMCVCVCVCVYLSGEFLLSKRDLHITSLKDNE